MSEALVGRLVEHVLERGFLTVETAAEATGAAPGLVRAILRKEGPVIMRAARMERVRHEFAQAALNHVRAARRAQKLVDERQEFEQRLEAKAKQKSDAERRETDRLRAEIHRLKVELERHETTMRPIAEVRAAAQSQGLLVNGDGLVIEGNRVTETPNNPTQPETAAKPHIERRPANG